MDISKIKCFLLDLDGTVYLDDVLFPKVLETISYLRGQGRIIFLTNNSSKSKETYMEKLKRIGLPITDEEIYTSGMATIEYLHEFYPNKKVHLLGSNALVNEFKKANIHLTEDNPDIMVLGYDTDLNYQKLTSFTNNLHLKNIYIATHPDINCPAVPYFVPDIGAMMQMIEASTGRKADIVIGKPFTIMGENIKKKYGLKDYEIAMVGDRLYTDIDFANKCNFTSILVLSGETSKEDYEKSDIKATIVLNTIADLLGE